MLLSHNIAAASAAAAEGDSISGIPEASGSGSSCACKGGQHVDRQQWASRSRQHGGMQQETDSLHQFADSTGPGLGPGARGLESGPCGVGPGAWVRGLECLGLWLGLRLREQKEIEKERA